MLTRTVKKAEAVFFTLAAIAVALPAVAQTLTPEPARQEELIHLLRNDCGACHGLRLTGGLGPTLRPEALHNKTAENLKQVILLGRPGTPMPGWAPFMNENEAQWLAESLVRGLPDEN